MLVIAITAVHIIVCVFLILVVLLQSGSAGDIAAAFGGMGSQAAFGPRRGATLLGKLTTAGAVIFILTSITLTIMSSKRTQGGSVLGGAQPAATQEQQVPPQQQQPLEGQPPTSPQQ